MRCNNCGSNIPDGSRFCRECGNRVVSAKDEMPEWTYEESDSNRQKYIKEVVLNSPLANPSTPHLQKGKKKSNLWVWIVALFLVAAIFPSKKSDSGKTSSSPTPSPISMPKTVATVKESSSPSPAKPEETSEPKWYETEPTVIEYTSFKEETHTDGVDTFMYKVPVSWQKRHDPGSICTYYYPFKDSNKTFLQVQLSTIDFDLESLGENAYDFLWSSYIDSIVKGLNKIVSSVVVKPCIVNSKKIAYITCDFSYADYHGMMHTAVFVSHNKALLIGMLLADNEKELDIDDFFAILYSVNTTDGLISRESIYPKSVETSIILNATEPPDQVYNTPASENGLDGNVYFLDGIVKENFSVPNDYLGLEHQAFVLETAKGNVIVSDMYSATVQYIESKAEELGDEYEALRSVWIEPDADYSIPDIGSSVRVIGYYVGFSEKYKMPSFYYGYPNWLQAQDMEKNKDQIATISEPIATKAPIPTPSLAPTPTPTPTPTSTPMPTPTPTPKPTIKPTSTPKPTKKPESISYSTNDKSTVKNGNSGVYAYKNHGGTYDNYWIVDFDAGYVYNFSNGNGNDYCDRVKIDSGDLNTVVIITYNDGYDKWQYGLHFKWARQPDHLILQDEDGFEFDFYSTGLDNALRIRDTKKIVDF